MQGAIYDGLFVVKLTFFMRFTNCWRKKKTANLSGRQLFLFPAEVLFESLAQMASVEVGVYLGGEYALVAE